jgi:hypothetical protein
MMKVLSTGSGSRHWITVESKQRFLSYTIQDSSRGTDTAQFKQPYPPNPAYIQIAKPSRPSIIVSNA